MIKQIFYEGTRVVIKKNLPKIIKVLGFGAGAITAFTLMVYFAKQPINEE